MRKMVECQCRYCGRKFLRRNSRVRLGETEFFCGPSCKSQWLKRTEHSLVGKRFSRLTVMALAETGRGKCKWKCQCDCGKVCTPQEGNLLSGHTKSCGCGHPCGKNHPNYLHGATHTRTYHIWKHVWSRCTKKYNKKYQDYGGRGIHVCDRWASFENFLADMGEAPDGMSIDRKDKDGPYSPENCQWADAFQQANNSRKNLRVTIGRRTQTLAQWCRELNLPYRTVWARIKRGCQAKEALNLPVREARMGQQSLFPVEGPP